MGQEENPRWGSDTPSPAASTIVEQYAAERAAQKEAERRALEDAKADQCAVWALADLYMTPDLREYGERHKIPNFGEFLWRSAFVAGWRAAMRAKPEAS